MKNETLFFSQSGYPSGFVLSQAETESAIRKSINCYGKNRNIQDIRYVDLKQCFKHFQRFTSKFAGAICTTEICEVEPEYENDPYVWVENTGTVIAVHRVEALVALTKHKADSRNGFVAQSLFPLLFTQLMTTKDSPCKILSSKPIYSLCMVPEDIDIEPSVIRDFNFVSAAGVMVLAPLRCKPIIASRALTIEKMAEAQSSLGMFSIDEDARTLKARRDGLVRLLNHDGGINGSTEKFGMLSLLSAALVAKRSGYRIDYQELSIWLDEIRIKRSGTKIQHLENVEDFLTRLDD